MATRYTDRPVRGGARAEQGVGGCRVVAGFGFPAAEEPDRVIAVADQLDRRCHSPGRVNHVRVEPGQVPAFRFDVAPCALNAVQRISHAPLSTPPCTLVAITILALPLVPGKPEHGTGAVVPGVRDADARGITTRSCR